MTERITRAGAFASEKALQSLPPGSRVLVAAADRVGDALFRTPAIRLLGRSFPHIRFDALAFGSGAHAVLSQHPDLDTVHHRTDKKDIARLAEDYDLVVNTRSSNIRRYLEKVQTPIIQHRRIETTQHKAKDLLLFAHALAPRSSSSPLSAYCEYVLPIAHEVQSRVRRKLTQDYGVAPETHSLIGMHIGCGSLTKYKLFFSFQSLVNHKKTWPIKHFISLAHRLVQQDSKRRILIIGSQNEDFLCRKILNKAPRTINICPDFSLLETAALMDHLDLLICNDSGPMHMACARKRPLLALFGPTNPQRTGPFPELPQFTSIKKDSMRHIGVDEVWTLAEQAMRGVRDTQ
ncbi:glycosyltransferase family 9 protein [Desulfovermiculus halophilus]|jgi:ADP-heptose:LPS heptosyltransferase|uniref:glycosyltransferase family 9 protein n=1 Tax=Desulfovermiculus halophilus TaxID=339722 RepID=UPI0004867631|nr:glycosyltransferase family 9 protein [Desulfovermiculus halophilus]